ncbi:ATP-binding protein [Actinomadura sp. 21ATH]|uniref:ATP-binding protein n=1 Tax=Actinomadura sp. 21ATH TaxID=1735444 RepID=UPI0035C10999
MIETSAAPQSIVIPAVPEAVKQARDFVAKAFGAWGLEDYIARTVVSELATNAVRHGSADSDPVIVRAYLLGGRPVVEVWDRSDALPAVRPEHFAAESGRGLLLLDQLVPCWGTRPLVEGGKVVWAELEPVPAV